MNWNAIGALGEVFGALAVFITLAFLVVQIRHARVEARRRAATDFVARNLAVMAKLSDDPVFREIHIRAIRDYDGLPEIDKLAWQTWMLAWIANFQQLLVDAADTGIRGIEVERIAAGIASVLRTPGGRQYWARHRERYFDDRTRSILERRLAELDDRPID